MGATGFVSLHQSGDAPTLGSRNCAFIHPEPFTTSNFRLFGRQLVRIDGLLIPSWYAIDTLLGQETGEKSCQGLFWKKIAPLNSVGNGAVKKLRRSASGRRKDGPELPCVLRLNKLFIVSMDHRRGVPRPRRGFPFVLRRCQ